MTNEQIFIDWRPEKDIPSILFVESLIDNYDGLAIEIKGEKTSDRVLRIYFSDPLMYRNINESYYLRTIESASKRSSHPLVVVENSELIKWFHAESFDIYSDTDIIHYLIFTGNDCIDVLSTESPVVKWL